MTDYKMGGHIVRTLFRHGNVANEFSTYAVHGMGNPDVTIEIVQRSFTGPTGNFLAHDGYKDIVTDDRGCYYIYKHNRQIAFSRLTINPMGDNATISIGVKENVKVDELTNIELRFAILDPFFAYLCSRGIFPLHSCGLLFGGKCVLVSGASGSGKSAIGRILVQKYGARYMGEDVNACSSDGRVWGLPFSAINNNFESTVDTVVFLGERTMRLGMSSVEEELVKSEFGNRSVPTCVEAAKKVASCFVNNARSFMISTCGQTEDESALQVYDLAMGKGDL